MTFTFISLVILAASTSGVLTAMAINKLMDYLVPPNVPEDELVDFLPDKLETNNVSDYLTDDSDNESMSSRDTEYKEF